MWVDAMDAASARSDALGTSGSLHPSESPNRGLAPLLRLWRARVSTRLELVPRPDDEPHTSAPGPNSDRILVFGGGLAVGWGVTTHGLALPGFLARALTSLTGRGTDVDIVASPDKRLKNALRELEALPLWRYDAIVIVLGVNEALELASLKKWRRNLSAILSTVAQTVGVPVVMAGIQTIRSIPIYDSAFGGIADAQASALNRVSAEVCAEASQSIFVPLSDLAFPPSDRHRVPGDYAESARMLATAMLPALDARRHSSDDPHRPFPHDHDRAEADRQDAVDALDLSQVLVTPAIERLLNIAQTSFQVPAAGLTVLDGGTQRIRGTAWPSLVELPRVGSFCDTTIRQRGGMVVPDALKDERFCDYTLVVDYPHIRFYAGYPLESLRGERIGALCVFDTEPHPADDADLARLRDLALLVQRELREYR